MKIDTCYVICPYCGYKYDGEYEFENNVLFNDESKEMECEECNKKFWTKRIIAVNYTTESDCELNNEEHKKGEYHCEKCDVYNNSMKENGGEDVR